MDVTPEYKIKLMRELRQRQTESEASLWQHLRGRKLNGLKFRRQHPIGRFIADFCCEEARLVVEVDGPYHDLPDQRNNDRERDPHISGRGYLILRVTNEDVTNNLWKVLERIRQTAAIPLPDSILLTNPLCEAGVGNATGTPRPLRERGRG